jgi:hypothetical protein
MINTLCDKCWTRFCSGDCTIQLKIEDTHTIAAIASEFMTNHRYQAWYDENCDNLGGTPAIWEKLSGIALEIIDAERKLRVDWGEYDWMEMIVELIDRMYTDGLDQKWGLVLVDILKDQDGLFEIEVQQQNEKL